MMAPDFCIEYETSATMWKARAWYLRVRSCCPAHGYLRWRGRVLLMAAREAHGEFA